MPQFEIRFQMELQIKLVSPTYNGYSRIWLCEIYAVFILSNSVTMNIIMPYVCLTPFRGFLCPLSLNSWHELQNCAKSNLNTATLHISPEFGLPKCVSGGCMCNTHSFFYLCHFAGATCSVGVFFSTPTPTFPGRRLCGPYSTGFLI